MSKITTAILFIVIAGVTLGTAFGVPYLADGPGALIVFALVYAYIVAKRELAVMPLERAIEVEARGKEQDSPPPVIADWLAQAPRQLQMAT